MVKAAASAVQKLCTRGHKVGRWHGIVDNLLLGKFAYFEI